MDHTKVRNPMKKSRPSIFRFTLLFAFVDLVCLFIFNIIVNIVIATQTVSYVFVKKYNRRFTSAEKWKLIAASFFADLFLMSLIFYIATLAPESESITLDTAVSAIIISSIINLITIIVSFLIISRLMMKMVIEQRIKKAIIKDDYSKLTECLTCGSPDIYKGTIEDGGHGWWCPHCKKSLYKMRYEEAIKQIEIEEALAESGVSTTEGISRTIQCPTCASMDVYQTQIEDGSVGDWCPHCRKSLQKMQTKDEESITKILIQERFSFLAQLKSAKSTREKIGIVLVLIILLFVMVVIYLVP